MRHESVLYWSIHFIFYVLKFLNTVWKFPLISSWGVIKSQFDLNLTSNPLTHLKNMNFFLRPFERGHLLLLFHAPFSLIFKHKACFLKNLFWSPFPPHYQSLWNPAEGNGRFHRFSTGQGSALRFTIGVTQPHHVHDGAPLISLFPVI